MCVTHCAALTWPSPSCLTLHLGLQGDWPEIPGATDVALTLVEAMAQHGNPPCDEQNAWHVTGPDSWLPADTWFLELAWKIIEQHLHGMPLDLAAGFGSMAGLRRRVVAAFVLRWDPALSPLHLGWLKTWRLTDHPCVFCKI